MTDIMTTPRDRITKNLKAACLGLLAVGLFLSACEKEEANCTRLWKRLHQCGLPVEPRDTFVDQCDPARPYTADLIECSESTFCADFRFCRERAMLESDVRGTLSQMDESIAKNEFFVAVNPCNHPVLMSRPQMKAKCQYTLQRSLAYYQKYILAYLHSQLPPVDGASQALQHCALLQKTAAMIGPAEVAQTLALFDRIARKNPGATLTWCEASRDYLSPELADRCAPVPALAHAANLERALAIQRALDAPVRPLQPGEAPLPKPDTFSACYDLKRTGRLLGPAALKDAERICTELDLQAYVAAAMPAVEAGLRPRKPSLPLECMPPYINSKFKLD
ncbi:MAG: hypothetical protein CVU59_05900, partial [Deltaproteobacteria bacterium HGW-Deltaproteobacteria-17]